jgi:hypothetical protein
MFIFAVLSRVDPIKDISQYLPQSFCTNKESDSSVSTVSDYGLDDRGSIPDRGRGDFTSSLCAQTGFGTDNGFTYEINYYNL